MANKNRILLEVSKGNQTARVYEKEIAKCGAYSLGRSMRITYLPLTPQEFAHLRKQKR